MKTTTNNLPVYSVNNRKDNIDPKPQYQRGAVWSEGNKQLLIDSILRGYDIPKFYLREMEAGSAYDFEVVDGQQRLRAIWDFIAGAFPLGEESRNFPDMEDMAGKYWNEFSKDQQDLILGFNLSLTEIRSASEIEIRELFLRLQEGKSLSPAEKRNAMMGNMRDFVVNLSERPIFLKTAIKNKRFDYDDLAAHCVCLELAQGPTDVKAQSLKVMYEQYENFDQLGAVAKKTTKVLNYLNKVFTTQTPELDVKWGFVDLYLLVSYCLDNYVIKDRHSDFFGFYIGFENERRSVSDPSDLISGTHSPWDRDLYDYIEAFRREGNKKARLQARYDVYLRKFLDDYPDLVSMDPVRSFSRDERIVIWRRAGQKCQESECGISVDLHEMHADHIDPHVSGGRTLLANAQCLCASCNLKKSDS